MKANAIQDLRSGTVASSDTSVFHTLKGMGRGEKGIVIYGTCDQVNDGWQLCNNVIKTYKSAFVQEFFNPLL